MIELHIVSESKICSKCSETKSLDQFYYHKSRNWYEGRCKTCAIKKTMENNQKHSNRTNKSNLEWRNRNPEKIKEIYRVSNLKRKFNLSIEDYNKMFFDQKGRCKICDKHQNQFKKALAVDHCHTTGKIRGLLCASCNTAIGHLKDDVNLLAKAINYLKEV